MFDSPFTKYYDSNPDEKKFTMQSIESRGTVLHFMCNLEMMINIYVAKFFCGMNQTKIEEMILLVLGDERMSLNAKAQVFYYIASNHDKKWYQSYVSNRKHPENKKFYSMNNDLVFAIEERNIFAHRVLDNGHLIENSKIPDGSFRFVRAKNELESLDYDKEKYIEIVNVILNLQRHMFPVLKDTIETFK